MDLREISFGVEIETVKRRRERVARAIQSVVGGDVRHVGSPACFDPWEVTDTQGRVWKVVADGSLINVPGHLRAEVVSPVLGYEDIPTLQEVIRAVRRCGAKVDEKCGIHIHVDARPFDGRTLANLAKIIYKQEALILTALGVNENRLRNYSKPVSDELIRKIERSRPRTKDQLNRIWYGYHNRRPQHFDSTRDSGVNLHNVWYRGTVELRPCFASAVLRTRASGARAPFARLRLASRGQDRAQAPAGGAAGRLGLQARQAEAQTEGRTFRPEGRDARGGRATNPASGVFGARRSSPTTGTSRATSTWSCATPRCWPISNWWSKGICP